MNCHIEFIFFNMSQCEQEMNCSCAIWAKQTFFFFFFCPTHGIYFELFCLFLFGANDEQLLNGQYLEIFLYVHFNNGPNCVSCRMILAILAVFKAIISNTKFLAQGWAIFSLIVHWPNAWLILQTISSFTFHFQLLQ